MSIESYLRMLLQMYEDDVVPSMVDAGDHDERIEELKQLIKNL